MDEYVIMNKSDLTTMANTIRETLGSTDSIVVGDLANKLTEAIEAGSGGGVKLTTGTIVPLENILTISHGLGAVPDYFIAYVEDGTINASNTDIKSYQMPEGVIRLVSGAANWGYSMFFAICNNSYLVRTAFAGSSSWGYYTRTTDLDAVSGDRRYCPLMDEEVISWEKLLRVSNPFPCDADGSFTIRWFAISGVTK